MKTEGGTDDLESLGSFEPEHSSSGRRSSVESVGNRINDAVEVELHAGTNVPQANSLHEGIGDYMTADPAADVVSTPGTPRQVNLANLSDECIANTNGSPQSDASGIRHCLVQHSSAVSDGPTTAAPQSHNSRDSVAGDLTSPLRSMDPEQRLSSVEEHVSHTDFPQQHVPHNNSHQQSGLYHEDMAPTESSAESSDIEMDLTTDTSSDNDSLDISLSMTSGDSSSTISTMSAVASIHSESTYYSEHEPPSPNGDVVDSVEDSSDSNEQSGSTDTVNNSGSAEMDHEQLRHNGSLSTEGLQDGMDNRLFGDNIPRRVSHGESELSIDDTSTRHSTDVPSRGSTDRGTPTHEHHTPEGNIMIGRSDSSHSVGVNSDYEHSALLSRQSAVHRTTSVQSDTVIPVHADENLQYVRESIGEADYHYSGPEESVANRLGDRRLSEIYDVDTAQGLSQYSKDVGALMYDHAGLVNENHDIEDEDEGCIFLIPDNFNPYAPTSDLHSLSPGKLSGKRPVYNAQEQKSDLNDQQDNDQDTLNFTFSHRDASPIDQNDTPNVDNTNPSENVSICHFGSPKRQHNGALGEQQCEVQTPGKLKTTYMHSPDGPRTYPLYEHNQEPVGMTFSERVQRFVANELNSRSSDDLSRGNVSYPQTQDGFNKCVSDSLQSKESCTDDSVQSFGSNITPRNDEQSQGVAGSTAFIDGDNLYGQVRMGSVTPRIGSAMSHDAELVSHPPPNSLSPSHSSDNHRRTSKAIHLSIVDSISSIDSSHSKNTCTSREGYSTGNEFRYSANFYSNIFREKTQRRDEKQNFGLLNQGARSDFKRAKYGDKHDSNLTHVHGYSHTKARIVVMGVENLVQDAYKSVKIMLGAKLSGTGYLNQHNIDTAYARRLMPHEKLKEDAKALLMDFVAKLKVVNSLKAQISRCLSEGTKHSPMLEISRETYCLLVKQCGHLTESIKQRETFIELQRKIAEMKMERLHRLHQEISALEQRNCKLDAERTRKEQLDRAVSTLNNIYTATGIKVVPIDTGVPQVRWCFAVAFNADCSTQRFVKNFRKSWTDDIIRIAENHVDKIIRRDFRYHRVKVEQRFNPEVDMLVYLRCDGDNIGNGDFFPSCTRSIVRLDDDSSPDVNGPKRTPTGRGHIPSFMLNEIQSNSPSSAGTPLASRHRGSLTHAANRPNVNSIGAISPGPVGVPQATSNVNWNDEMDIAEISRGLRIVFTAPRLKTGGEQVKVWEQALMQLLDAANKRIDRLTSRLMMDRVADHQPITLLALLREIMDYGSALSARIRVVQRELLQLLSNSCMPSLVVSSNMMTIEVTLTPRDPTQTSLRCALDIDAYDLLQRGSYARAAVDIRVQALQPGNETLERDIKAAISQAHKDTIYDLISSACTQSGNPLYN
ncbi:hypothetical protein BaOVIS_027440 [Babesia ovis]|uniref:Uncharacterized protein n=1 Tax=Babesia ovis TaxID=5869 RepID=A0A9W5TD52_BABOV|nr:hypothetical protein BaOVIS_027440 [Babesia ovis]